MFARTAKIRDIERVRTAAPVPSIHSNDNCIDRRMAADPGRPRKRGLECRWRLNPLSGRPECHWTVESEPDPRPDADRPRLVKLPRAL